MALHHLKIVLCIMALLFGGCTLLHRPISEVSLPQKTRSGLSIKDSSKDFSQVMWWKRMHDPVLNYLIREALANNNQIHMAQATILQAQAKLKEAQLAWLPTLSASGNSITGRTWDSSFKPQGELLSSPALRQLGEIRFQGYFGGFVPNYSLNILENINKNKFNKASLAKQTAVYNATKLSIISQISGAYFMLLGQREQLDEQIQLIHDFKKVRQLETIRFKDGASDLTTLIQLDQQISSNQAQLASIENSIAQIENAISVLLNRNPASIITARNMHSLSIYRLIPANLPSAVLRNRPDVIIAEENLKMATASIGVAYSNFFPTFTLTGLLGGASVNLVNFFKLSTGIGLAQAAASVPILSGVAYHQIKEAKAGYDASYFSYIQTLRTVFAEVNNSLTNQEKKNEAYVQLLKSYQITKKGYKLALARYQLGAKDNREVANAQLLLDSAKLNLSLAKMQQLDSIVQVYQALAGGYKA